MPGPVQAPPGYTVIARDAVHSTQDEIRALAAEGAADGTVLWAARQLTGRGRLARHWDSPEGNLYVSLLVRTGVDLADAAQLSFITALAVFYALGRHLAGKARLALKWPNDVLLDGAKVAGILLETETGTDGGQPLVMIGVGVNLVSHPADAAYPATDLTSAGCGHLTPAGLLGDYLAAFAEWRQRWQDGGFAPVHEAWLDRAAGLGGPVTARMPGQTLTGRFVTLDERGALVLETETGTRHRVTAGDVFF